MTNSNVNADTSGVGCLVASFGTTPSDDGRERPKPARYPADAAMNRSKLLFSPFEVDLHKSGYRYALTLTRNREDAEDLVQEGWLNLHRLYGSVESHALLNTAVRNLHIDRCRRKKIVTFVSIDGEDPRSLPSIDAAESGLKGDLDVMLSALRPIERDSLMLHYYCGFTAMEIAETTNRSRGTVLSIIHRAVAKLRLAATDDHE